LSFEFDSIIINENVGARATNAKRARLFYFFFFFIIFFYFFIIS